MLKSSPRTSVWQSEAWLNLRAAALLGLISSSFSTLVSQVLAARIGRDAAVDWMVVATIPLRDPMLHIDPPWWAIAVGILFHQWADFSWEVFFFGVLGRWTARLKPLSILLAVVLPWAVLTSAAEWFVLVPLLPFVQPVFPLEQPYWIGLLVHLCSASIYPLFPFIRDWLAGRLPSPNRRFTAIYAGLAASIALGFAVLAFLGLKGHEPAWAGRDAARDQAYMRRMSAHHAQGIEAATLAAEKAIDPHLRALARLFAAEQIGERTIFDQWWGSWFVGPPQVCGPDERAAMPGMLTPAEMDELRRTDGPAFDPLFVKLMSRHHAGAAAMADAELNNADADPRLRIMAEAIRHGQQGEIEMMRGTHGLPAVKAAWGNMFAARLVLP